MRRLDITGRRFGRLTVLGFSHRKGNRLFWLCICDCGTEIAIRGYSLTTGRTASCGCFREEVLHDVHLKHGHRKRNQRHHRSPTYISWQSMFIRCYNPKCASWPRYGGKGIKVCERWHDFSAFLKDMGERPAGMTLHRLDHNKDYEPSNCEWRKPPH